MQNDGKIVNVSMCSVRIQHFISFHFKRRRKKMMEHTKKGKEMKNGKNEHTTLID